MDTGVFELPNAICTDHGQWVREIELAEMTGEEEDILADQTRVVGKGKLARRADQRMTEILSRCTVRMGDWTRPDGKDRFNAPTFFVRAWENAYTNDRAFSIIKLRQVSLGDTMRIEETCPACDKELKRVVIDLNELEAHPIPFETACQIRRKVVLPKSQHVITWRAFTGKDESLLEEIQANRKGDMLSAVLQARVVEVNNMPVSNVLEYVQRMSQRDRRFLSQHIDESEGGLDTSVHITCDNCGNAFSRQLNVGHRSFFFPSEV